MIKTDLAYQSHKFTQKHSHSRSTLVFMSQQWEGGGSGGCPYMAQESPATVMQRCILNIYAKVNDCLFFENVISIAEATTYLSVKSPGPLTKVIWLSLIVSYACKDFSEWYKWIHIK